MSDAEETVAQARAKPSTSLASVSAPNAIAIRGGQLADGIADETYLADVLVIDGIIAEIAEPGTLAVPSDACVIDATGLLIMPGFIDTHVHGDAAILEPEVQEALTRQGVTTVVLGQDGLSFAPSPQSDGYYDACGFAERYFAAINGTHPSFRSGSVAELLDTYDETTTVDSVYLVPHGTIRYAVMGGADRAASPSEIQAMAQLLLEGLADGAKGMSTGLEYAPACYADRVELHTLLSVLAPAGLPHVSHMRGYEDRAGLAVAELTSLARDTGVATHISHYHGPSRELISYVEDAHRAGLDVTFDSYPYLCGASILALVSLPTWLPLSEPDRVVELLEDQKTLDRLRRKWFPRIAAVWERITLAFVPDDEYRWTEGMKLVEVAAHFDEAPQETALRLLRATGLRVGCVFAQPPTNSEESVRALMRHPSHMAGSDGIYLGGRPHPRGWGMFARDLGRHVRELGDWTWADAAKHLAANGAARFALSDRGRVIVGARADLVVLDTMLVADTASYEEPRRAAVGVQHVMVGGTLTLHDGSMTGALPGRAVR